MKLKQIIVYCRYLNYSSYVPGWVVSLIWEGDETQSQYYWTKAEAEADAYVIQQYFGGTLEVM